MKNTIVLEDLDLNIELLEILLKDLVYPTFYKSSDDFLKFYDDKKYDIIILDIYVPGKMNGIGVCKYLRKNMVTKPIIIQTAYNERKEESIAAGCDDFIDKPINIRKFKQIIKKYL